MQSERRLDRVNSFHAGRLVPDHRPSGGCAASSASSSSGVNVSARAEQPRAAPKRARARSRRGRRRDRRAANRPPVWVFSQMDAVASEGANWDGEYEAMDRLLLGRGSNYRQALIDDGRLRRLRPLSTIGSFSCAPRLRSLSRRCWRTNYSCCSRARRGAEHGPEGTR
jgi:hypothetical protein